MPARDEPDPHGPKAALRQSGAGTALTGHCWAVELHKQHAVQLTQQKPINHNYCTYLNGPQQYNQVMEPCDFETP
jgi:hypothetical protein